MRFRLANFVSMPRMQKEPDIEHNAVLSNTDSVPERPKSVLSSRVWGIAYPIHLVALGMTVAVLQLNFRKVYFADVGTQGFLGTMDVNEVIKAIQFAAKLHEIFMVASLTAIVSHLTRSCLLGKRGVPLGLLSAPFKVGSADYIFSREFFNSITWTHGLFSLGLLLGTIFMLGLGPASAMALAPSLGWWNIADPYSGLDRPIWVSSHPHDIWPQTITRQLHSCHSMDNSTVNCPGDGAHDLKAWAAAKSHTERPANITMLEAVSGARRRLQTQSEDMSNTTMLSYLPYASALDNTHTSGQSLHEYLYSAGPTTLTTTSSHWVTMLLGEFWNYAKDVNLGLINRSARPAFQIDESIPIYEPLVSARCSLYDYSTRIGTQDELLAPFVRNAFGATGITENTWGWQIPSSTWNFSRPMNALNFTWIDLQGLDVNASIGGLFSAPISVRAPNGTYLQESLLVPCTIEARWIASELINDPMSSDIVSDNVSDPLDLAHNAEQDAGEATARFGASPIINITSDWANQLNLPTTRFRLPGDNHSIPNLVEDFVGVDDESIYSLMTGSTSLSEDSKDIAWEVSKELAIVLGLEVADGLSRVNYGTLDMAVIYHQNSTTASRSSLTKQKDITGMLYNRTHAADPLSSMAANGSWYSMQVQRWGYGYGLGTKASHFSVSMLIIYGCIAIAYLVWFNIQNQTRKHSDWSLITHKWSSISELVALAINSPPTPKLDGTCAGIDNKQTWKQIIRVRECEGDHLALFVGERPDEHPRVQRNVQYGALRPDPGRPVPEAQRGDDIGFSRWRMMQSHVR